MNATLLVALVLGIRHGTDPDHLTAIDGLARIRPRATNGLLFALGHGLVVTLLAVGCGDMIAHRVGFLGPWVLILIGAINLFKVLRPSQTPVQTYRVVIAQPFLLGMLLAAGFETSSQFAAMMLTTQMSPWLIGLFFTSGMVIVDGLDGYLAASTQFLATRTKRSALSASRVLGFVVAGFSFGLGGAELLDLDIDRFMLPTGLLLFAVVVALRIWARKGGRRVRDPIAITGDTGNLELVSNPSGDRIRNVDSMTKSICFEGSFGPISGDTATSWTPVSLR